MKKSILLFSAILITITAFGFIKWDITKTDKKNTAIKSAEKKPEAPLPFYVPRPTNLYYDLGSRFGPIKKSAVNKSTSVRDFFTAYDREHITAVHKTNLIVIKNDEHSEIQFKGEGDNLSQEQLNFLRSCQYSTNLKLMIQCRAKGQYNDKEEWAEYSPHFSIVPEQQASYSLGKEALIEYIKEGNKKNTYGLDPKKLGLAKFNFTVSKTGELENIKLDRSCGYESIDKEVKALLENAPGNWIPAITAEGLHVNQELVLSFGTGGC